MSYDLRKKARINYYEPEEPRFDDYMYCDECADFVYEYCSVHGSVLVIPDDKVPSKTSFPSYVPRAALTIPKQFLHLAPSIIPGAGVGVFSSLTLPRGVRFGPYRGVRTQDVDSMYCWQIFDRDHKRSHVINAVDGELSNWLRYVNCARHWREQNLVAYQYQGQIYYRTIKIVPRFTELLVYYGSEFANALRIDLRKYVDDKYFNEIRYSNTTFATTQTNNLSINDNIPTLALEEIDVTASISNEIIRDDSDNNILNNTISPTVIDNGDTVTINFNNTDITEFNHNDDNTFDYSNTENSEFKRNGNTMAVNFSNKENLELKHTRYTSGSSDTELKNDNSVVKFGNTEYSKFNHNGNTMAVNFGNKEHLKLKHNRYNRTNGSSNTEYSEFKHGNKAVELSNTENTEFKHNSNMTVDFSITENSEFKRIEDNVTSDIGNTKTSSNHNGGTMSVIFSDTENTELKHICNECGKPFAKNYYLIRHIRTMHTHTDTLQCNKCDYKTTTKHNLLNHMINHKKREKFTCQYCNLKTNHKSLYLTHAPCYIAIKNTGISQNDGRKNNKAYYKNPRQCGVCDFKTISRKVFQTHTYRHQDCIYKCDFCNYNTYCKYYLSRHIKKHGF